MTLNVNVQGGTNAGRKRPFNDKAPEWECKCRTNPGWLTRCPSCEQERPE